MSIFEESREADQRRRLGRVVAVAIATCVTCVALVAEAPVAGASNDAAKRTPAVGIAPFAGDVFTTDSNNDLIQVDPRSTPASAPLYNLDGNPLGLTWGQWSSATATSLAKATLMRSRLAAFSIFGSNDESVEPVCFAVARQYASGRLIGCRCRSRAASTPIASFGWCTVTPRAAIASRAAASFETSAEGAISTSVRLTTLTAQAS